MLKVVLFLDGVWLFTCRAGLSLSAYNYDSAYGKMALTVMYRGIMEQVSILYLFIIIILQPSVFI